MSVAVIRAHLLCIHDIFLSRRRRSVKAVADGAVSFFIDHHVMARVAKISYGAPCSRTYNASDPEHVKRSEHRYMRPSGDYSLPGGFSTILPKVR